MVGIDARGVVALESFVMARYMMFASVYFHHTTRLFERILQDVLRELWPDPRALDPTSTSFLRWDDFRVLNELRDVESEAARALRERIRIYALRGGVQCRSAICAPSRRARAPCASASAQMRCGPTSSRRSCTACRSSAIQEFAHGVGRNARPALVDAREVSDLIAKLSGKAYWRKLFVRRDRADVREARASAPKSSRGFS